MGVNDKSELARLLVTRRLLVKLLELTLIRISWTFNFNCRQKGLCITNGMLPLLCACTAGKQVGIAFVISGVHWAFHGGYGFPDLQLPGRHKLQSTINAGYGLH